MKIFGVKYFKSNIIKIFSKFYESNFLNLFYDEFFENILYPNISNKI